MIYAIGDIHGMKDKLVGLIDLLPIEADDHLIFIGDYIDRGPDPFGVVEYLVGLRERQRCTFLLGNHESMFLAFLGWEGDAYFGADAFRENGGEVTLESYGYSAQAGSLELPSAHEDFYRSLELSYAEGAHVFVHAGLSREVLQVSDVDHARAHTTPRDLLWRRDTAELPHSVGATIVYGHTPTPDFQIRWNLPYSIGIDTGAVYGGPLTALRLPDETTFQV